MLKPVSWLGLFYHFLQHTGSSSVILLKSPFICSKSHGISQSFSPSVLCTLRHSANNWRHSFFVSFSYGTLLLFKLICEAPRLFFAIGQWPFLISCSWIFTHVIWFKQFMKNIKSLRRSKCQGINKRFPPILSSDLFNIVVIISVKSAAPVFMIPEKITLLF